MANGINGVGGGVSPIPPALQELGRSGFPIPGPGSQGETSFAKTLEKALGQVSDLQANAQDAISAFLRGDPVEVHEVMAAAEEAGIALDMLIEIRNKLTEAYRTVISTQT
jgi:flagellar hook-basal body complex protein FliE